MGGDFYKKSKKSHKVVFCGIFIDEMPNVGFLIQNSTFKIHNFRPGSE
jgi:hypothetical protein